MTKVDGPDTNTDSPDTDQFTSSFRVYTSTSPYDNNKIVWATAGLSDSAQTGSELERHTFQHSGRLGSRATPPVPHTDGAIEVSGGKIRGFEGSGELTATFNGADTVEKGTTHTAAKPTSLVLKYTPEASFTGTIKLNLDPGLLNVDADKITVSGITVEPNKTEATDPTAPNVSWTVETPVGANQPFTVTLKEVGIPNSTRSLKFTSNIGTDDSCYWWI